MKRTNFELVCSFMAWTWGLSTMFLVFGYEINHSFTLPAGMFGFLLGCFSFYTLVYKKNK